MGSFLIVSKAEQLEEYRKIAEDYQVSFEINDFFEPMVLNDAKRQQLLIEQYLASGIPTGSTMHGAFLDVVIFSQDDQIRRISEKRMEQSMMIGRKLGVKGVVFHTNYNPMLSGPEYDASMIDMTSAYLEKLLVSFPDIQIYLENMFDADPHILIQLSERLKRFDNYGVCLDYAHACISNTQIDRWITELSVYMKHIHINDNDLKRDLHQAVGDGQIDWEQFAGYYHTCLRHCSVLIETTLPEAQRKSLEFLQKQFWWS